MMSRRPPVRRVLPNSDPIPGGGSVNDSIANERWAVGTLVAKNVGGSDTNLRLVIGYKPDGRCMTVAVSPPWVSDVSGEIYVNRPEDLHRVESPWADPYVLSHC